MIGLVLFFIFVLGFFGQIQVRQLSSGGWLLDRGLALFKSAWGCTCQDAEGFLSLEVVESSEKT